ncbi:MAG: hypothetical protein RL701_4598, partial [Pseudomonadota bacterium]
MTDSEAYWESAQDGAELVGEGEPEQALQLLGELVAREPDNEYAYFWMGAAYYELEQYDHALKAYLTALKIKPNYVGAMVHVGHSLRMMGRYTEAIRMAQQVLLRAKDDSDALFLIGAASFALGEDAPARQYLERFLHTNPELEVAHEVRGMLELIIARTGGDQDD